jgi:hypothetical protein
VNGFRSSLCHSCYSPDLNESRPRSCKCRKLVTRAQAVEMVGRGEADWALDQDGIPTWNIAYLGRTSKTPRAHTLETSNPVRSPHSFGQIERGIDIAMNFSDEGAMARNVELAALGDFEQMELFELYHDLEMEERYKLFGHENMPRVIGGQLQELKKFSDTFGTVEGAEGKYVADIITGRADELKTAAAVDDPYEGRTLFPMIGWDQRTKS